MAKDVKSKTELKLVKTEKGQQIEDEKIENATRQKASPEELAAKKGELLTRRHEYDNRLYFIEGGLRIANLLKEFILNNSHWTYKEAIGVIELDKILTKQIELVQSGTQDNIQISGLAIESIHYYLSKETGKGVVEAQQFMLLLDPIGQATIRLAAEFEKLQQLEFEFASLETGLSVENIKPTSVNPVSEQGTSTVIG